MGSGFRESHPAKSRASLHWHLLAKHLRSPILKRIMPMRPKNREEITHSASARSLKHELSQVLAFRVLDACVGQLECCLGGCQHGIVEKDGVRILNITCTSYIPGQP